MSPRPRKVSDEDVMAAAYRAMQRIGPRELTLAEIAAEAGVTAGALAQRYGSKRALMLALAEGAAAGAGDMVRALRAEHPSPIATIRAYAECLAEMASSPAALARSLAYLQIDLADPDFRAHLLVHGHGTREALRELVDEAAEAGELARGTDTKRLTRTVEVALNGALFTWALYQEGSAKRFLRDAVDAVVAPYLRRRKQEAGNRKQETGSRK